MVLARAALIAAVVVGCGAVTACGEGDIPSQQASALEVVATETSAPRIAPAEAVESAARAAPASPDPAAGDPAGAPTSPESIAPEPPPVPVPAPKLQSAPAASPRAAELDARSPDQVVADAGERGRSYLSGLRAAGLPPTGMDAAEILYAQGTCDALGKGTPRPEVLREFAGVGEAYAKFTPIPADRVAEIYVSTAERSYC
ncbi:DUF732 domain-containing protein [Rhodococcus sp. NPDC059234]|uniref:DUF732 domain-containing protein n=1 Tax=Rhodococcus sp. NPDC059234 TaxID=3346781 RepID=UPI00366B3030